ncbi:MAG TPA: hypothetical protein VH593_09485 [Ktedonobacteraceae bacterium]
MDKHNGVDAAQAAYWLGPVSRREAQNVFEEYGNAINHHAGMIAKLDLIIAMLADKLQITPEEVQAWTAAKLEAAKKAEPQSTPEPSNLIVN